MYNDLLAVTSTPSSPIAPNSRYQHAYVRSQVDFVTYQRPMYVRF